MNINIKEVLARCGLKQAVLHIRGLLMRLNAYRRWSALRKHDRILLELGSGTKRGVNGWTTVDLFGADISYNLSQGIPLLNESVDRIYTSHMLEHIKYKDMLYFINECFRVLKKGGEFSVCVPNAKLYIQAYMNNVQFRAKEDCYEDALIETGSFIDQVNYIAYMGGQHNYMFDPDNLINTLKKAPFSDVRLRRFDESLDLKERDFESLYAIAIK